MVALALGGCGPPAAEREKLLAGQSKFFAELAREDDSGKFKAHFDRRFPDLRFEVAAKYPTIKRSPRGRDKLEAEVSLIVTNPPPNYAAIQPLLLDELESYLVGRLAACEMKLDGSVRPLMQKERKRGFWFNYGFKTHAGSLRVDLQDYALGTTLITVEEE